MTRRKRKKVGIVLGLAIAGLVATLVLVGVPVKGKKEMVDDVKKSNPAAVNVLATKQKELTFGPTLKPVFKPNPKDEEAAIAHEKNAKKRIYLTFDDGPSANTDRILDILKKYNIKATFFNMRPQRKEYLKGQKRAYEEGHTIGIHTVNHDYEQLYSSFDAWRGDILGEHDALYKELGIDSKFYRFPGGSSNTLAKQYGTDIKKCIVWLNENGYKYFDWNSENGDGRGASRTVNQAYENVMSQIGDYGDYDVLMHDATNKNTTVEALPLIIEALKNKGFTFCQVTKNTIPVHHIEINDI